MRFVFILALFGLISCSSPGLKYSGVSPVRVAVEDSVFDVYALGEEVQIIRLSVEMLPKRAIIAARALAAIEQATGCPVVAGSMIGDQALMEARIDCG